MRALLIALALLAIWLGAACASSLGPRRRGDRQRATFTG
jgi:hypothetical protein